LYVKLSKCEF
jgi:hypothetical protein